MGGEALRSSAILVRQGHLHKNEGEVVTAGDGEMLASENGPNEGQYETVKEKVHIGGERRGGREGQKNQLKTDYAGTL